MARIDVRYLICLAGSRGGLPRYFWQPSSRLRALGYRPQRVPMDWDRYTDAAALADAAIVRARELNRELDEQQATAALASVRPPAPVADRTLDALIADYRTNGNWTTLAPKTRRSYTQCLDRIAAWGGPTPVRRIGAADVQFLLKTMAGTPAFAAAVARVLSLLMEHARRAGWIAVNPAMRPGLPGAAPSGIVWPRAAVDLFVATADAMGWPSIGTAVTINEWLGQREGDILRLPRQALRNGTLMIRQSKTKAGVALPVHMLGHVMQRLEGEAGRVAARARDGVLPTTILVCEGTGLPWKEDYFRHVFAAIRAKAAETQPQGFEIDYLMPGRDMTDPGAFTIRMQDLTFMHLRHTAVTRNGEAEVDPTLISAITGHSVATVVQLLARYMVKTAKMATVAFQKRMNAEGIGQTVETLKGGVG